jgi:hypothetical protein
VCNEPVLDLGAVRDWLIGKSRSYICSECEAQTLADPSMPRLVMYCRACGRQVAVRTTYYKYPIPLFYCFHCNSYLGEGDWEEDDDRDYGGYPDAYDDW